MSTTELTDQQQKALAERAFGLDQTIKAGIRTGREAMWNVAAALHEFDEMDGWAALGFEKLSDWLADPEMGMTRRSYYRWVALYRELAVNRQVPEADLRQLDVSKVDVVLPKIKTGEVDLQHALDDARELGFRDLREQYIDRPDPKDEMPASDRPTDTDDNDGDDPVPAQAPVNPTDDVPVVAAIVEPAHNPPAGDSGQDQPSSVIDAPVAYEQSATDVHTVALDLARVMWRVAEEVAPKEKKHMRQDLRDEVQRVLSEAIKIGLLDA
jgi:hypothetical protein